MHFKRQSLLFNDFFNLSSFPQADKIYQIAIAFAEVSGSTTLAAGLSAEMAAQKPNIETA